MPITEGGPQRHATPLSVVGTNASQLTHIISPSLKCGPHISMVAGSIVDTRYSRLVARYMIEDSLNYVGEDSKFCHVGCHRTPNIMKPELGNAVQPLV